MLKVSRLADYAVVILSAFCQKNEGVEAQLLSAGAVSELTALPEPTVAKVLKLLARENIVISTRGAGGGYALSRPGAQISIADIVKAVDGPISLTACVEGASDACDYESCCPVRGRWDDVNLAIKGALETISLEDMVSHQVPDFIDLNEKNQGS